MIIGAKRMNELFQRIAVLKVDKSDLRRISDLISTKLRDLLVMGERTASYNRRDIILEQDLPMTKGLQETLQEFRTLEEEIELRPILKNLATYPPLGRDLSSEVEAMLPDLAGGLLLIIARSLKLIDPELRNPETIHFEKVNELLKLTL